MPCSQLNFLVLICIYLAAFAHVSLQSDNKTRSVKKDLNLSISATAEPAHSLNPTNQSQSTNLATDVRPQEADTMAKMRNLIIQKNIDDTESFEMGFYFLIGLSVAALMFILVKIYRLRLSRAERKYGVHSDRTTQELTPLPMAIEDDSDNDDHTLFDINRQIRVS